MHADFNQMIRHRIGSIPKRLFYAGWAIMALGIAIFIFIALFVTYADVYSYSVAINKTADLDSLPVKISPAAQVGDIDPSGPVNIRLANGGNAGPAAIIHIQAPIACLIIRPHAVTRTFIEKELQHAGTLIAVVSVHGNKYNIAHRFFRHQ